MQTPLKLTYRNVESSPEIDALVEERALWLEGYFPRIIGCRVTVDRPHRRHSHGNAYQVRVDVSVPGDELIASRTADEDSGHDSLARAVRDTFHAMRRELEDWARRVRDGKRQEISVR